MQADLWLVVLMFVACCFAAATWVSSTRLASSASATGAPSSFVYASALPDSLCGPCRSGWWFRRWIATASMSCAWPPGRRTSSSRRSCLVRRDHTWLRLRGIALTPSRCVCVRRRAAAAGHLGQGGAPKSGRGAAHALAGDHGAGPQRRGLCRRRQELRTRAALGARTRSALGSASHLFCAGPCVAAIDALDCSLG